MTIPRAMPRGFYSTMIAKDRAGRSPRPYRRSPAICQKGVERMAVPSAALRSHNVFETIVSALVIVVALAFLVFFYASTGTGRFRSYVLSARMADASGLDLNADVRVGGIKVGSVTGLTVMPKTYLA